MSANSRQLIIDAAAAIFSRCGYHLSSMDVIAESAGVAKGTLYYHFSGKGALFSTVVIEGLEMLTQQTRASMLSTDNFESILRKTISIHIKIYTEYQDLATIVFNESVSGLDQQYFDQIKAAKQNHLSILASLFNQGYQQGICRQIDFSLAAEYFITLLDCTCRHYLKKSDKVTSEMAADTFYQMITNGLLISR